MFVGSGYLSGYSDSLPGWTVRVSNPGGGGASYSAPALGPTKPPMEWVPGPFPGDKSARSWR
jgi:hypothetical protein